MNSTPPIAGPLMRAGINSRGVLLLNTTYQASKPQYPSIMLLTLTGTCQISLLSTTESSQKGSIYYAPNAADALSGTGTATLVGTYENTQAGTLVVTLILIQTLSQVIPFLLPANYFFAVKQTLGSQLAITNAFDQAVGP